MGKKKTSKTKISDIGFIALGPIPEQVCPVDNGVESITTILASDIRNITVENGTIVSLKMKRRGTYRGKYFSRSIHKHKFK